MSACLGLPPSFQPLINPFVHNPSVAPMNRSRKKKMMVSKFSLRSIHQGSPHISCNAMLTPSDGMARLKPWPSETPLCRTNNAEILLVTYQLDPLGSSMQSSSTLNARTSPDAAAEPLEAPDDTNVPWRPV
jgi:hypothetical protein